MSNPGAAAASPSVLDGRIAAVRRFNRFYTRRIGVLQEGLLESPFSLTQMRVLYELAHRHDPTASDLCQELGLDAGYLSRILRGFEKQGLVARAPSKADGRQAHLRLTARGRQTFGTLDARSSQEVGRMLAKLGDEGQRRVVEAMGAIEQALGGGATDRVAYVLRPPQPGDMGWVVHRHGALYAEEYGWDERFEALVAGIVADFMKANDPRRERCWMAERDGALVGSVFLVQQTKTVAKLRLLLVEPSARGLGIGRRLVEECVRFARQAGYRTLRLWTNDVLTAARRIYEQEGFRLVQREKNTSFGEGLVGETWELDLRRAALP